MRIAISLLWLRHKSSGGVESYTRNILDGLKLHEDENFYFLLCSRDNFHSFASYAADPRFHICKCDVNTRDTKRMLLFENFKLDKLVSRLGADLCYVPTYRMPLLFSRNKYVVVIHDLVAYWYPKYFSFIRRKWLQWGWKRSVEKAKKVVAITKFVKADIITRYGEKYSKKVDVIYNPILPSIDLECFDAVANEYGIEEYQYFYTVSSTMKHKNLITLVLLMDAYVKMYGKKGTPKLLISGVGMSGPEAYSHFITAEVLSLVKERDLEDVCIFTGFVSNERRNTLMKYSKVFLFSSVFEGFGMPPVEALRLGTPVVSTNCTALPEVTQGRCEYVKNPYDIDEWMKSISNVENRERVEYVFEGYCINQVIEHYFQCFNDTIGILKD